MDFITQNMGTIVVLLFLAIIVGLIINKMQKDKKNGNGGCGCGCSGCAMKDNCPSQKKK